MLRDVSTNDDSQVRFYLYRTKSQQPLSQDPQRTDYSNRNPTFMSRLLGTEARKNVYRNKPQTDPRGSLNMFINRINSIIYFGEVIVFVFPPGLCLRITAVHRLGLTSCLNLTNTKKWPTTAACCRSITTSATSKVTSILTFVRFHVLRCCLLKSCKMI